MLSSVTIDCQITKIVMDSGSQLSELLSVSQMSQISLRERWTKKNRKKLTNVSLVCMYVGRKSEMSVFFSVFFPTEVIYRLFQWSLRKKTEKCQFLWSMYVCKAKTDICQFFSVFFYAPFPKGACKKTTFFGNFSQHGGEGVARIPKLL